MNKKIKLKNICILFLLPFVMISCKSRNDLFVKKLDGGYIVNEMMYEGESIMNNVMAAILSFDNKEELLFKPPIVKDEIGKYEKYTWSFSKNKKNDYLLNFDSGHKYFRGDFKISFNIDYENRQLNLILQSDKTYINCTRLYVFENFDELKDNWEKT